MANQEHLDILKQGRDVWNRWREEHPELQPDLSDFNLTELSNRDLSNINFSSTNLIRATLAFTDLSGANLQSANALYTIVLRAKFDGANVEGTAFSFSILSEADFTNAIHINRVIINGANLSRANFSNCDLSGANFSECNLREANLSGTNLSGANLTGAKLHGCRVYASATWGIQLDEKTIQTDLIITRKDEPLLTVDNLEVAQFIYLLLNNQKIRDVIDTITSKVALILGRFTPERKQILDAMRDELRKHNYLPVLFDFDKPASRDLTETITTLAHLARFIIVDLTDPVAPPMKFATIIPQTIVPVQPLLTLQPLIVEGKAIERHEYAMFEDLRRRYHWVLPTFRYQDTSDLLASLQQQVIAPTEQKAKELAQR